jgi:predicted acyltransferase
MNKAISLNQEQSRILSIDFFRGFTMFMLVGEFSEFFSAMVDPSLDGTIISGIGKQLHHVNWVGLHFWDLIQPFFMFIVGVAMPFSFSKRWDKGDSWNTTLRHALTRSALLLLFGWALYCIEPGKITWHFTNVLAQLSVTYLIAFLVMRKAVKWQLVISFSLILLSDLLYRFWSVEGYNEAWTPDHNFGSWFDMAFQGSLSPGHWVSFNAIPTTAHTIWGVIAGMLLMNDWKPYKKIKILLITGMIGLIVGYSMNPFIPIIKHICTSSFIIVSGGWCFIGLGISYWLIDVLNFRKFPVFFAIVGMNPLFIYMFAHMGGNNFLHSIAKPFTNGLFSWSSDLTREMVLSLTVWFMLWYICYWLYKRKIFIKL